MPGLAGLRAVYEEGAASEACRARACAEAHSSAQMGAKQRATRHQIVAAAEAELSAFGRVRVAPAPLVCPRPHDSFDREALHPPAHARAFASATRPIFRRSFALAMRAGRKRVRRLRDVPFVMLTD